MNPIDDALQTKEAFLGSFMKTDAGKAMAGGAMATVGAAAVGGVHLAAKKLFAAGTKRRDFRSMMDTNPDLSGAQQSNPKFFNASYNSVRSLNPSYGGDPVVSGSLMRRMMQSPESAGTILMSTMKAPPPGGQGSGFSVEHQGGPLRYKQDL